jgi:hypothetical protein
MATLRQAPHCDKHRIAVLVVMAALALPGYISASNSNHHHEDNNTLQDYTCPTLPLCQEVAQAQTTSQKLKQIYTPEIPLLSKFGIHFLRDVCLSKTRELSGTVSTIIAIHGLNVAHGQKCYLEAGAPPNAVYSIKNCTIHPVYLSSQEEEEQANHENGINTPYYSTGNDHNRAWPEMDHPHLHTHDNMHNHDKKNDYIQDERSQNKDPGNVFIARHMKCTCTRWPVVSMPPKSDPTSTHDRRDARAGSLAIFMSPTAPWTLGHFVSDTVVSLYAIMKVCMHVCVHA